MKVASDVLEVLGRMTFEGSRAFLPPGQLDRRLYVATDKVLQACGGSWNRSAKAHVFSGSASELVDAVITTGQVQTSADIGFFPTPAPLAARLVAMAGIRRGLRVLEPSAGTGRIIDAMLEAGADDVWFVERDAAMRAELGDRLRVHGAVWGDCDDFMDYEPRYGGSGGIKKFDRIVMNSPFCRIGKGDHLDHVRHAHYLLATGGILVAVLPSSVTFRKDVRHEEFRAWVEGAGGVIEDLPAGSFKESGTGVNTVVVRFDYSSPGDVVIKPAGTAGLLTCGNCEVGFRRVDGIHIGSQRLGMIPDTPCDRVHTTHGGSMTEDNDKPWMAYVDGEPLRKKSGDARRFKTAEAAYRAACKGAPRMWHE